MKKARQAFAGRAVIATPRVTADHQQHLTLTTISKELKRQVNSEENFEKLTRLNNRHILCGKLRSVPCSGMFPDCQNDFHKEQNYDNDLENFRAVVARLGRDDLVNLLQHRDRASEIHAPLFEAKILLTTFRFRRSIQQLNR